MLQGGMVIKLILVSISGLFLFSSFTFGSENPSFLNNRSQFEEKLNEQSRAKAKNSEFYLAWDVFKSTVNENCNLISKFAQGHSRVVRAFFKNGSYYISIEPEIDDIYDQYDNCSKIDSSIKLITQ